MERRVEGLPNGSVREYRFVGSSGILFLMDDGAASQAGWLVNPDAKTLNTTPFFKGNPFKTLATGFYGSAIIRCGVSYSGTAQCQIPGVGPDFPFEAGASDAILVVFEKGVHGKPPVW